MFVCSSEGLNSVTSDIPSSSSGSQIIISPSTKETPDPPSFCHRPKQCGCLRAGAIYILSALLEGYSEFILAS